MPFKDIRAYMEFLRKRGELKTCSVAVDTGVEIARVTDKSSKTDGPAILFTNVKGFGTQVVTGLFGTIDRGFLALETDKHNCFKKLACGLDNPMPCKLVKEAACQEVVKKGKQVDLNEIPALRHHQKDSHHFITATVCRAVDPDTGVANSSINRLAVQSGDKLTVQSVIPHQLGIIIRKNMEKGKTCAVAIAVGTDPATLACAGCGIPYGMDEFAFTGGVIGEPLETVKCRTIDVDVPATSELVIEGEVRPGNEDGYAGKTEYASEAPFGEISGYFGRQTRSPVIHVTAITHRKDYIYHGLGTAEPPSEHQILQCVTAQGTVFSLARTVLPAENIKAINPLLGAAGFAVAIAIDKRYPGQAKQLIYALLTKTSLKRIIVVNEDIDIFSPVELEWAVSFRASADDYIITSEIPGVSLDPMVTTPPNQMRKIGIDATLPLDGDKKGRLEVLRDLGPARYPDLSRVNLADYIK